MPCGWCLLSVSQWTGCAIEWSVLVARPDRIGGVGGLERDCNTTNGIRNSITIISQREMLPRSTRLICLRQTPRASLLDDRQKHPSRPAAIAVAVAAASPVLLVAEHTPLAAPDIALPLRVPPSPPV